MQLLFGKLGKCLFDVYKVVNKACKEIEQCNCGRNDVNVRFFDVKALEELGSSACKYRNKEGYKTDDNGKEQTNGNYLCNGAVTGSCNFLGRGVNNCTVEVGSGSNEDLREGEYQTDCANNTCIKGGHANGKVKHCYTARNRQRADDATEKHLGEQKLGGFYREGFCLESRFAVSCNVGRTEGVGQNTKYQNNKERQRELKAAAERVKDQGLKQRVAAVDHKGHCKRNGKVREQILGLTVNRNKLFSKQACGYVALNAKADLHAAGSAIAVSVKNQTVESCGNQECEEECCYGKACRNEDRFLHVKAEQERCERVCGVGVCLSSHQNVYKVAGEQELDRAGFKQAAQNVEDAGVNEEGAYNENGKCNKGEEVSCAQELDDDHVRQDQKRCQQEGYHREQQVNDCRVDEELSARTKHKVEDCVYGKDQHKCRNVCPKQKSCELCTEDGAVLNRQAQKDRDIRASCKRAAHFFKAHNTKCHYDNGVDRVDELVRSCNGVVYLVYLNLKVAVGNRINEQAENAGNDNREDDRRKDAENVNPFAL